MRLDIYLAASGYAQSRSRAQMMIAAGRIFVNGRATTKCAYELKEGDGVEIKSADMPYVGRGAIKLQAALDRFEISAEGMTAIDIGASTGGFTDCLLRRGAKYVVAVDSGHGQLDKALLADSRVLSLEGVNARTLTVALTGVIADIIVMDVSFISQTLIHPVIPALLKDDGVFISLIKPQFEAGRELVGKNGIVRSKAAHMLAVSRVIDSAEKRGLYCEGFTRSPITGGDGNCEYLAAFRKNAALSRAVVTEEDIKAVILEDAQRNRNL